MSSKKASILNIVTALFFASLIIISSYLMEGSEQKDTIMYLLIAVWFIPFTYFSKIENKYKKARKC